MLRKILGIALVLTFILPSLTLAQTKRKITLLLYNGKVFTADEKHSIAEAVAVDGEKIVAVGTSKDLKAKYQATKEIDLQGRLVTPGFNDAHAHFLRGALALLNVDLTGIKTLDEAKQKIADKAKTLKAGEWLTGRGWDHTLWGGKFPTKADLDAVAPNNPVYLVRVDGHVGWANSAALKLAGIDRKTANPNGGEIERDSNSEATGIMKETAQGLVSRFVPPPTPEQSVKGLELALDMAKKYAITSVHDISGYETTKLYRQFLNQDKLTVRITEMQTFDDSIETLKKQRTEFATFKDNPSRLKLGALKGYVDGTLGSKTAAMLEPFTDDPHNSGIPRRTPEELTKMIVERDKEGFQIALHAIGDKANRMALDGFEVAKYGEKTTPKKDEKDSNQTKNEQIIQKPTTTLRNSDDARNLKPTGASTPTGIFTVYDGTALRKGEYTFNITNSSGHQETNLRHRIEHAQVVNPSDFKRFAELGIIASMQPTHAISDKRWAESRLGEYRVLGSYSWHLMRSYGVHVPFGTDFPVESINPYRTLYAAVSRQDEEGNPVGGWQPQEKVTMAEAIRCHTYESAYAEFAEKEKGEIKVGMYADLIVHSKDLLTIPHKEIMQTEPVYTIFNGKIIYQK